MASLEWKLTRKTCRRIWDYVKATVAAIQRLLDIPYPFVDIQNSLESSAVVEVSSPWCFLLNSGLTAAEPSVSTATLQALRAVSVEGREHGGPRANLRP